MQSPAPGGTLRPDPRWQRGMVTVELAIGFMTAVIVTAALVGIAMLGVAQAACAESSAQIARQEARGDAVAVAEARRRAPEGASITVDHQLEGVVARVSMPVRVLKLGPITVEAQAWAAYEPGIGP